MATIKEFPIGEARDLVDVGIVAIREDEFAAVLKRFPPQGMAMGRSIYNISRFSDANNQQHHAALVRTAEQGDIAANSTVRALIDDLKPSLIILIGIAGGKPESEFTLGDVIVATRMYDFTVRAATPEGTVEYAIRGAPAHLLAQQYAANLGAFSDALGDWNSDASIGMPSPSVKITKSNLYGDPAWVAKVRSALEHNFDHSGKKRPPIVFSGAIASGSTLIKDPRVIQEWLSLARELKAVEMEIAGAYEAARAIAENIPVIAIRGISDIVGFKRDAAWTAYACNSAASFLYAFLSAGILSGLLTKRSKAEKYEGRSEVAPPLGHPPQTRLPSDLSVLPLLGVNFVRLGTDNYTKNAPFAFSIGVKVTSPRNHFALMGFEALYVAPDGCLCTNGTGQIVINDRLVTTSGNYFEFAKPFRISDGVAHVAYNRQVRPPLMEQMPADCDFGDLWIRVKALWDDSQRGFERFFRFWDDGNLTEIAAIREPPILSDTILNKALLKGLVTKEDIDRARLVDATARYQIVNFGHLIKEAYSRALGRLEITQDYRLFLQDLHRRTLDRSMLEEFYDS